MFSLAGRIQSIFQHPQSWFVVFLVPDVLPGCHLPGSIVLPVSLGWEHFSSINFQSESLRVRETPLSFCAVGSTQRKVSSVSGGRASPCLIATSAQGMHSWQQETSGALVWVAALGEEQGRAPGWRCGVWEELNRARQGARGGIGLGEQQSTP